MPSRKVQFETADARQGVALGDERYLHLAEERSDVPLTVPQHRHADLPGAEGLVPELAPDRGLDWARRQRKQFAVHNQPGRPEGRVCQHPDGRPRRWPHDLLELVAAYLAVAALERQAPAVADLIVSDEIAGDAFRDDFVA